MRKYKISDEERVFYTADLHFNHSNIIKLCNRPFKDTMEMNHALIENWNAVVRPGDHVFVVGDFAWKESGVWLNQLNGIIHLLRGNHDRDCSGFVSVDDIAIVEHKNQKIVLCHYPMVEWEGSYRGSLHFYGHIHNNNTNQACSLMKQVKNAYNVGVDLHGYTPRTLRDICILL